MRTAPAYGYRPGKARGTASAHPDEQHGRRLLRHRPDRAGGQMGPRGHRRDGPRRGAGLPRGFRRGEKERYQAAARGGRVSDGRRPRGDGGRGIAPGRPHHRAGL